MLYRPFLHHALSRVQEDKLSLKAYACGSACIKAGMQVVWLVEQMESREVFNPAHWFVTLILAHIAACLVLFVTGASDPPIGDETKDGVQRLKSVCSRHVAHNYSIRQCLKFLEVFQSFTRCFQSLRLTQS